MDMSESEDETKNSEEMIEELQRLREQPAILGQTSIGMMEEFRNFPWTQAKTMAVGTPESVLVKYLQKELQIGEEIIGG